jgi:predicted nucleic acid-binding protein
MIVLDASVVVEFLLDGALAEPLWELRGEQWIVPHLLDVEVASALRGLTTAKRLGPHRASELLIDLISLPAHRHSHAGLLPRMWELRHTFTTYDAAYIALAEQTRSVLYTTDRKMIDSHSAKAVLFTV